MHVASPCIQHCRLDPAGVVCLGCFRTLDEIARWPGATDEERRAVLRRVALRRTALTEAAHPARQDHVAG